MPRSCSWQSGTPLPRAIAVGGYDCDATSPVKRLEECIDATSGARRRHSSLVAIPTAREENYMLPSDTIDCVGCAYLPDASTTAVTHRRLKAGNPVRAAGG